MLTSWSGCKAQSPPGPKPPAPGQVSGSDVPTGDNPPEPQQKRIFGIIPNYRTFPAMAHYAPLHSGEKLKIATQDSFDRGTFMLAAGFAAEGQLTGANPSFGHGLSAYGRYFATSYADFVIGDYMTEGIYPSLFHQDPRYFRKGQGTTISRLGYAVQQLFWTRSDAGHGQFNVSEVGGNATAVLISNAYYKDNRTVGDGITKFGTQIAVDMASNMLKEFSSDLARKVSRRHQAAEVHNPR